MLWRRIFICVATLVTLLVAMNLCLRAKNQVELVTLSHSSTDPFVLLQQRSMLSLFVLPGHGMAESCFPFVWQQAQRERLRALLSHTTAMPVGTDEIALAKFEQYATKHPDEQVFREGIRREPHNALYHYLLADLYATQSLSGDGPHLDKKTGVVQFDYSVTDRRKLDQGMKELAIGLQLPFQSHRGPLLRAQLNAMPVMRNYDDHMKELTLFGEIVFPEYARLRHLARVNGFYLSLLLSEGKRVEAEPFLYTGEHLVVQISNDPPLTLIGQLVALAIGYICERNDAYVCHSFGLTREAAMIKAHQALLIGKVREWQKQGRLLQQEEMNTLIAEHAGMMPAMLLPVYGSQPAGLITKKSLAPSRLLEYVVVEGGVASLLSLFAFMLLLFAGLKYWRWRLVTGGAVPPALEMYLSSMDWWRIIGVGLLAPLVLYLCYLAFPAISWRDHGMCVAVVPFNMGIMFFVLWTLMVPTTVAADILWKRSIAAGLTTEVHLSDTRFMRVVISLYSAGWSILALPLLAFPISWGVLSLLLAHPPIHNMVLLLLMCLGVILLLGIPMLPAIWARKKDPLKVTWGEAPVIPAAPVAWVQKRIAHAPHHLAMARSMITVYAIMTLFFALLVPVCAVFEQHYVQVDQLTMTMRHGDDLSVNNVEGQLVIMLRQDVRDGAVTLGIPWK